MPIYNKLVRDYIPKIIEKSGKSYSVKTLDDDQYLNEIKNKMQEELEEYIEAKEDEEALKELADILELVYAAAAAYGATSEDIQRIREEKIKMRGGFSEKIYLLEVED
ncbi:nucleoside triphosphate pyrophosphohydrolase [Jeotgalibacillus proteolyticus]|uniref:nucleoside triphosphate pyrophosphohydrolase n=1 Tax=Jeotgalibacillus proteolyticus TaxID=2082395 RepID=UPI003CED9267